MHQLAKSWKAVVALLVPLIVPALDEWVTDLPAQWAAVVTSVATALGVYSARNAA